MSRTLASTSDIFENLTDALLDSCCIPIGDDSERTPGNHMSIIDTMDSLYGYGLQHGESIQTRVENLPWYNKPYKMIGKDLINPSSKKRSQHPNSPDTGVTTAPHVSKTQDRRSNGDSALAYGKSKSGINSGPAKRGKTGRKGQIAVPLMIGLNGKQYWGVIATSAAKKLPTETSSNYASVIIVGRRTVHLGSKYPSIEMAAQAHDRALIRALGPLECVYATAAANADEAHNLLNYPPAFYAKDPLNEFTCFDSLLKKQLFGSGWSGPKQCDFGFLITQLHHTGPISQRKKRQKGNYGPYGEDTDMMEGGGSQNVEMVGGEGGGGGRGGGGRDPSKRRTKRSVLMRAEDYYDGRDFSSDADDNDDSEEEDAGDDEEIEKEKDRGGYQEQQWYDYENVDHDNGDSYKRKRKHKGEGALKGAAVHRFPGRRSLNSDHDNNGSDDDNDDDNDDGSGNGGSGGGEDGGDHDDLYFKSDSPGHIASTVRTTTTTATASSSSSSSSNGSTGIKSATFTLDGAQIPEVGDMVMVMQWTKDCGKQQEKNSTPGFTSRIDRALVLEKIKPGWITLGLNSYRSTIRIRHTNVKLKFSAGPAAAGGINSARNTTVTEVVPIDSKQISPDQAREDQLLLDYFVSKSMIAGRSVAQLHVNTHNKPRSKYTPVAVSSSASSSARVSSYVALASKRKQLKDKQTRLRAAMQEYIHYPLPEPAPPLSSPQLSTAGSCEMAAAIPSTTGTGTDASASAGAGTGTTAQSSGHKEEQSGTQGAQDRADPTGRQVDSDAYNTVVPLCSMLDYSLPSANVEEDVDNNTNARETAVLLRRQQQQQWHKNVQLFSKTLYGVKMGGIPSTTCYILPQEMALVGQLMEHYLHVPHAALALALSKTSHSPPEALDSAPLMGGSLPAASVAHSSGSNSSRSSSSSREDGVEGIKQTTASAERREEEEEEEEVVVETSAINDAATTTAANGGGDVVEVKIGENEEEDEEEEITQDATVSSRSESGNDHGSTHEEHGKNSSSTSSTHDNPGREGQIGTAATTTTTDIGVAANPYSTASSTTAPFPIPLWCRSIVVGNAKSKEALVVMRKCIVDVLFPQLMLLPESGAGATTTGSSNTSTTAIAATSNFGGANGKQEAEDLDAELSNIDASIKFIRRMFYFETGHRPPPHHHLHNLKLFGVRSAATIPDASTTANGITNKGDHNAATLGASTTSTTGTSTTIRSSRYIFDLPTNLPASAVQMYHTTNSRATCVGFFHSRVEAALVREQVLGLTRPASSRGKYYYGGGVGRMNTGGGTDSSTDSSSSSSSTSASVSASTSTSTIGPCPSEKLGFHTTGSRTNGAAAATATSNAMADEISSEEQKVMANFAPHEVKLLTAIGNKINQYSWKYCISEIETK